MPVKKINKIEPDIRLIGKSIFILFGITERKNFDSNIYKTIQDYEVILCLDAHSFRLAEELFPDRVKYFFDDIFSPSEREAIRAYSLQLECSWWKDIADELSYEIKNLFILDAVALAGFWIEVAMEYAILQKCYLSNVPKIGLVRYKLNGYPIRQASSGTFGAIIQDSKKINSVKVFWIDKTNKNEQWISNKLLRLVKNSAKLFIGFLISIIRYGERLNKRNNNVKVLVCMSIGEWGYYNKIVSDLNVDNNWDVTLWIHNVNDIELKLKRGNIPKSIKVMGNPVSVPKDQEFRSVMSGVIDRIDIHNIIDTNDNELKKTLKHYFTERVPALHELRVYLEKIVSVNKYDIIISPNAVDYEVAVIRYIAEKAKIEHFVVTHGALGFPQRGWHFYGSYMVGSKYAAELCKTQGVTWDNLSIHPELAITREYQTFEKEYIKKEEKLNILVISDPVLCNDQYRVYSNAGLVGYGEQVKALRGIATLLNDTSFNVSYKHHPGWAESELVDIASKKLAAVTLSPLSDLLHYVESADVVICLNYFAIANSIITKLKKPVIFYFTAPLLLSNKLPIPRFSMICDAGVLVNSQADLVYELKKIALEPEYIKELQRKSESFYTKWFDSRGFDSIGKYVTNCFKE